MGFEFERVLPQSVGVDPQGVIDFIDSLKQKAVNMHSFMLVRRGKVAAECYYKPFAAGMLHNIYSVSKNITSAAVGLAISDGLIRLDDKIVDFFPEKIQGHNIHPYTRAMTVEHLLKMATVHPKSTDTSGDDWIKGFLTAPPVKMPGMSFAYDTTGTHTLCGIIQKVTGKAVNEYLREKLFDKIGIGEIEWITCPMGINVGGGGIKMTTEDMAKFGQLYLNMGVCGGEQVLPREWVIKSTSRQIDNTNASFMLDGRTGYGYKFWLGRHNSYICFGMGGQFIIVVPEKELVFVTTANTKQASDGHQLILDSFWDVLYPAIGDGTPQAAAEANARLDKIAGSLEMHIPDGKSTSPAAEIANGKAFAADENAAGYKSLVFGFDGQYGSLTLSSEKAQHKFSFKLCGWQEAKSPFADENAFCSGVWTDEKTLIINLQLKERMQMLTAYCHFEGGSAVVQISAAGGFVPEFSPYCGWVNCHMQ
mgnify:FL=1